MVPMELSPESWRKLHEVSTASLTSELLKLGFRNTFMAGVRPLRPDARLVGYAFTLRYIPAREDLDFQVEYDNWTNPQRVAVETIGPDQVLVIDARGQAGAASLGHILCTRLMVRGAAGLVTDGALRDSPGHRRARLPVVRRRCARHHQFGAAPSGGLRPADRLRRGHGAAGRRAGR